MHRSVKYLLQPTNRQRVRLDHLLWMQRNLYNASLAERIRAWDQDKHSITRYEQFATLNGMAETNPDLGQYGVCVARGTLTRLDLAYKAFYRRCRAGDKPGHPRFKGRFRFDSVSWPDAGGWRLDVDARRFYAMGVGHVRVKLHRRLPGRPTTAIVKREGRRWWVVVVCDQVPAQALAPTGSAVGIDVGVASLLTTSEGDHVANPRHMAGAAQRLASAQRDLARHRRGSARRRRAVQRVAGHHRKIANSRRDHAHKASRALVNAFDVIVHEDLAIANMVRSATGTVGDPGANVAAKAGLNRSIHDAGWGQLLRFIAYKAEGAGREVIAVDPRNTSRTCAACGHCEAADRPSQAVFRCTGCGHHDHADTNAAINILRAGLALRSQRAAQKNVA